MAEGRLQDSAQALTESRLTAATDSEKRQALAAQLSDAERAIAARDLKAQEMARDAARLQDQNDALTTRLAAVEAEAREIARVAGGVDAKELEIAGLRDELEALREDTETHRAKELQFQVPWGGRTQKRVFAVLGVLGSEARSVPPPPPPPV